MLTTQAHTLDAIFNNLTQTAFINAEYMSNLECSLSNWRCAHSRNAGRPWRRSRLSGIHQRWVMFVRRILPTGHKQVNNAAAAPGDASRAGAGENQNLKNELLEKKDGERLDPGTACTPGRTDPAMATVGEIDGTKDQGR